jgi:tRNA nucleotidyltransferase (CCA-adding enzyme)
MNTYHVDGSVRDKLLGLPAVNRDDVLVGALPERMIDAALLSLGEHVPVFCIR